MPVRRTAGLAAVLLPGVLTVYLAFNSGGFFGGAPAAVAVLLAVLLILRVTLVEQPFAGFSRGVALVAVAVALYAIWTLVSVAWSEAPARALLEFDRALLYLLAVVLFGSMSGSPGRLAWMIRGLALGIVVVCLAALVTRVLPDVWPTAPNVANDRLSYPLSYWNALGILAAIGIVLCLHLASSLREPVVARVLGTAALPILAPPLLFTFSRGSIAVCIVGVLTLLAVGRPAGAVGALLAAAPTAAVAVRSAYDADLLATDTPTVARAVEQGHDVALTVALCVVGAAVLRLLLVPVDRRVQSLLAGRRSLRRGLLVAGAVLGLAMFAALDAPSYVGRQYDRFVESDVPESGDRRSRLTDPGNNGRLDQWRVARDAFEAKPITGQGAGTYQLLWSKERPTRDVVIDAHSLYVESAAELGVVGLVLIVIAVLALLIGLAPRARGPDRGVYAALLAASVAWALHAGVDWDWEMPAVTLWMFALGGAGLAARGAPPDAGRLTRVPRVAIGLGLIILALTPVAVAISQHQLHRGVEAFRAGDCATTVDASLSSLSALSIRPEPWELLGYCDARGGFERLGVRAFENAVERDPDNWEAHYGLSIVRGAAGLDPLPEARKALSLNPRDRRAADLVRRFRVREPRAWMKRAATAPVLVR